VEQGWFYAEGEQSVGPVSLDALTTALRRLPEPGAVLVWRSGFTDWRAAKDIAELADRLFKPVPAIAAPDPSLDRWSGADSRSDAAWDDDGLPAARKRRWPQIAAIAVAVAIVGAGGLYAARNASPPAEPESRIALPVAPAVEQPKAEAARIDPAAVLARLSAEATQASAATEGLAFKIWAAIEPGGMQPPDYATASRADLETYVRDLKKAEANVSDAYTSYTALLKAERDLIEEKARDSGLDDDTRAQLMAQVGDRQSASLERITRMLHARVDLYRAIQAMQAIPIEQFGKYKSGPEGIRFSSKALTDRFAAAAAEVNAANKRLDQIEERLLPKPPPTQPGWQEMVTKPPDVPSVLGGPRQ
jgi:hypothetical protein